jgi:hypothetical protein
VWAGGGWREVRVLAGGGRSECWREEGRESAGGECALVMRRCYLCIDRPTYMRRCYL